MKNELAIAGQLDFNRLTPDSFAERVSRLEEQYGEAIYQHPIIQEAANFYQNEFYKRRAQYRPSSLTRLNNAWNSFVEWCISNDRQSLPATHEVIEAYLIAEQERLHRNTLKVVLWGISTMHKISGLPNACEHRNVKGRMAAIINEKVESRERISQAPPFREVHLDALTTLWHKHKSINKRRDLMVLSICYETMLRKSNIERILIEEITFKPDGTARLVVPYTKTNHSGNDEVRYLSEPVTDLIKDYLANSAVINKPKHYLLQRLKHSGNARMKGIEKHNRGAEPVSSMFVQRIFDRAWEALGNSAQGKAFSPHSSRVGATQDLLEEGFTHLQVMQSGGWSSIEMVIRYGRDIDAENAAMAIKRRRKK